MFPISQTTRVIVAREPLTIESHYAQTINNTTASIDAEEEVDVKITIKNYIKLQDRAVVPVNPALPNASDQDNFYDPIEVEIMQIPMEVTRLPWDPISMEQINCAYDMLMTALKVPSSRVEWRNTRKHFCYNMVFANVFKRVCPEYPWPGSAPKYTDRSNIVAITNITQMLEIFGVKDVIYKENNNKTATAFIKFPIIAILCTSPLKKYSQLYFRFKTVAFSTETGCQVHAVKSDNYGDAKVQARNVKRVRMQIENVNN